MPITEAVSGRRARLALPALAAAVALLLAGCSAGAGNAADDNAAGRSDLNVALLTEPATFDFTQTAGAPIPAVLMGNVYEGLVTLNQDGEIRGQLAESWTVAEDGLSYDFALREGVKFNNGAAFTAEDVKFSIERVKNEWGLPQFKKLMDPVSSVDVLSPTEVRVRLSRPSYNWIVDMAGATIGLMFDQNGVRDLAATAVGTGPYKVTEWARGQYIKLEGREDYWGGKPPMETITLKLYADEVASANALMSGEVDMLYAMQDPQRDAQFTADERFIVNEGSSNGEVVLSLNNKVAPFDNPKVRQAFTHALDRRAIVDLAWAGFGLPLGAVVPPVSMYYEDYSQTFRHDPAKAKELLAEAGVSGLSVSFDVPDRPYAMAAAEVIVSQLAEVGVTAQVNIVEFAVWVEKVFTNHDYQMSVVAHVEANDFLTMFTSPDYYFGYDNPEVGRLAAAADTSGSPAEWVEGMKAAVAASVPDAPAVPLYLASNIVVSNKNLTGIPANAVTEAMLLTTIAWQ